VLFCARLKVLIDLLSKHRHFHPPRYVKLLLTVLIALALQRAIKKEEKLYQEKIEGIEIGDDPVFIIGHWRSGTTYLHYLMSLDTENFACPTNYQCLLPTVFLTINEKSRIYKLLNRIMGMRTRIIDNMEFALTSPQEEEWMYMPLGAFSYIFEKLVFPETATSDFNEIIRLSNDDKTREVTLQIFKKLAFVHQKRILSKSPGHFARIPLLKQLFPQSKFIFIVRNPYSIVPSMIYAGSTLGKMLSFQKAFAEEIISVSKFLSFYFDIMNYNMKILKDHEYIILKFEDLINRPIRYIHDIYEKLDFKFPDKYGKDLTSYLQSIRNYKMNQFDLLPEMKQVIYAECHGIFNTYGYEK
jgi:omega-hydroxy-beta-dihydromenaquinone-9 sulfotransferase